MDAQQTTLFNAILITGCVIAAIIVYFIISIVGHQRRNKSLYQEKIKVEVVTLESERKRIASDLHDELGPLLSSVRLQVGCINSTDEEDLVIVRQSSKCIDNILYRLREISNGLMPHVLLQKGLAAAIEEFTNGINSTRALAIDFQCNDELVLSKEMEIHLYRIVQELIHNVLKHAKATVATVQFRITGNKLSLHIEDNGTGFDPETIRKTGRGLGLASMTRRVEMLNGDIFINSQSGKGTKFNIEISV